MASDLDVELQDATSSPAPVLDEQPAAEPAVETVAAESSPATGEQDDASLLSVVRDAVQARKEPKPAASPADRSEEKAKEAVEPDDENYSDVPFNKHPRFQHLLRQTRTYKVAAERYANVERFLSENGLSGEEANDGLQIMALAKLQPREAWEKVRPWVQSLLIAAGEVLPPELQQRVERGELTPDAAAEISRLTAGQKAALAQQQFREERQRTDAATAQASAITAAADAWQEERAARDPNFAAKIDLLQREVAYLHRSEGIPNTPQGVRAQLTSAYEAVNKRFTPPAPVRPKGAVRPLTTSQVAGKQASDTMTTLDIVRANRRA